MTRSINVYCLLVISLSLLWTGCEPVQQNPVQPIPPKIEKEFIATGRVLKQGADEHFGILVYIPGSKKISITDADGKFTLGDLEVGSSYTIRARADDFIDTQLTTLTLANSPTEFSIELGEFEIAAKPQSNNFQVSKNASAKSGIVLGKALLENQKANGGTIITARKGNRARFTATQHDGSFLLDDLEPGIHLLEYARDGFEPVNRNIEITTGKTLNLDTVNLKLIAEDTTGTLRQIKGRVVFESEDPVDPGFFEKVLVGLEDTQIITTPDSDGEFLLQNIVGGQYTLLASAADTDFELIEPITLNLNRGNVDNLIVTLAVPGPGEVEPGDLKGRVLLSDQQQDHSGIIVGITGTAFTSVTNRGGEYNITDVPPGIFELHFQKEGYLPTLLTKVEVLANKILDLEDLTLEKKLDRPVVVAVTPAPDQQNVMIDKVVPVFIRFNKKMEPNSVLKAFKISPVVDYKAYMGKDHPLSDYDQLYVELMGTKSDNILSYNTRYNITLAASASDYENLQMAAPFQSSFVTGSASVSGTWPESGATNVDVDNQQNIVVVYFNCIMNHKTLTPDNISIRPRPEINIRVEPYDNPRTGWTEIRVHTSWADNRRYSIQLSKKMRTSDGSYLDNLPYKFEFRTAREVIDSVNERPRFPNK